MNKHEYITEMENILDKNNEIKNASETRIYRFKAGTSKDEIIMGLIFPLTFMLPILLILLILEFAFPGENITHLVTINSLVEFFLLAPSFVFSFFLIKMIKKKLGHNFVVHIVNEEVVIYIDGDKKLLGNFEKAVVKEKRQMLRLDICGENGKFTFVGRNCHNPFGFCKEHDLLELRKLVEYLKQYNL